MSINFNSKSTLFQKPKRKVKSKYKLRNITLQLKLVPALQARNHKAKESFTLLCNYWPLSPKRFRLVLPFCFWKKKQKQTTLPVFFPMLLFCAMYSWTSSVSASVSVQLHSWNGTPFYISLPSVWKESLHGSNVDNELFMYWLYISFLPLSLKTLWKFIYMDGGTGLTRLGRHLFLWLLRGGCTTLHLFFLVPCFLWLIM